MIPSHDILIRCYDGANASPYAIDMESRNDLRMKRRAQHVWKYNMVAIMARESLAFQRMIASR